jgi:hypothetical protein
MASSRLRSCSGELPAALVERLRDADDLALDGADRHAQDVARGEAGLLVDRAVEAVVGVGVGDDQRLARGIDVAGHTAGIQDAYLALDVALRDARVQLVGIGIVEEQRAAFGIQLGSGHVHQRLQHLVERAVARHAARDFEQQLEVAQPAPAFLVAFAQFFLRAGGFDGRVDGVHVVLRRMASIWSRSAWTVCCSWAPSSANSVRSRLTELALSICASSRLSRRPADRLPQLCDFALRADQRRAYGIVGIGACALQFLAQCGRGGFQLMHFVVVDDALLLHRLVTLGARTFQLLAQGGRSGLEHLRFLAGGDALVLDRLVALDARPLELFAQGAHRGLQLCNLGSAGLGGAQG